VLTIRLGRRGRFVGCSGFPECDYTRNLDGSTQSNGPTVVGTDPASEQSVLLLSGPYGPYLQLGEAAEEGKKPKRVSLPKNLAPTAVTMDIALRLLSLPRDLGLHPETGKKVVVNIGRFGPYIQHDGGFRSIPRADNVFDIGLDRALAILAEPKALGRGALRVVGEHPDDGVSVTLHSGQYGKYVKHGKVNATLPAGSDADTLTLEDAVLLLAARAGKVGVGKGRGVSAAAKAGAKASATSKPKAAAKTKAKATSKAKAGAGTKAKPAVKAKAKPAAKAKAKAKAAIAAVSKAKSATSLATKARAEPVQAAKKLKASAAGRTKPAAKASSVTTAKVKAVAGLARRWASRPTSLEARLRGHVARLDGLAQQSVIALDLVTVMFSPLGQCLVEHARVSAVP
jgi:DNA topoisomerase-1